MNILEKYKQYKGVEALQPFTPLEQFLLSELENIQGRVSKLGIEPELLDYPAPQVKPLLEARAAVNHYFSVDITEKKRSLDIVIPRQMFCFWAKRNGYSMTLVGLLVHVNDSTAHKANQRVEDLKTVRDAKTLDVWQGFQKLGLF